MQILFHRQQGDVVGRGLAALPDTAQPCAARPIAAGDHTHVLVPSAGDDLRYAEDAQGLYSVSRLPTTLRHESLSGGAGEHDAQEIPAGVVLWSVVHEWDPWSEGDRIRQVQD